MNGPAEDQPGHVMKPIFATQPAAAGAVRRRTNPQNPMQLHDSTYTQHLGAVLPKASAAVVLLHGRGSSADDIAGLAEVFPGDDLAFLVPSASGGSWYPQRFLAPLEANEPWLSSALETIDGVVGEAREAGLPFERIGLIGFSQGACLALEYASRNPHRYGFVAGLSGALIGPADLSRSVVDLAGTPVLLGCAEGDAHIPHALVDRSAEVLSASNAAVTRYTFPGSAHTVFPAEVDWVRKQLAALRKVA